MNIFPWSVLEIKVKRRERNKYRNQEMLMQGKLALLDLASSEQALETNSGGQKLRDGAYINHALLALANCINALGEQQKNGLAYVPHRIRHVIVIVILKSSLALCLPATVLNVIISIITLNTLKHADRAKEIKTHIQVSAKYASKPIQLVHQTVTHSTIACSIC
ncbi:hypothetical protein ACFX1X_000572 [Malus domestica]